MLPQVVKTVVCSLCVIIVVIEIGFLILAGILVLLDKLERKMEELEKEDK